MDNQAVPAKKNAAQRLDDIEGGMGQFYTAFNNLAGEFQVAKDAIKLLGSKIDAVVQAIERNLPMNNDTISQIMIENTVAELKAKVTLLVEQHILVPVDTASGISFIVAQEMDDKGVAVRQRTQFSVDALPEELKLKALGCKAGDLLELAPGKFKLSIMEVYDIQTPEKPHEEAQ